MGQSGLHSLQTNHSTGCIASCTSTWGQVVMWTEGSGGNAYCLSLQWNVIIDLTPVNSQGCRQTIEKGGYVLMCTVDV